VQWEHQHAVAGVYADGSRPHALPGAELRGLERVRQRQCLWAGGDSVEDGDDLQLQLRKWHVRAERVHPDAGLYGHFISWVCGV